MLKRSNGIRTLAAILACLLIYDLEPGQAQQAAPVGQGESQSEEARSQTQREDSDRSERRRSRERRRGSDRRRQPSSRRSERVRMEQIEVASPNGTIRFVLLPNAERLTYTVKMGEVTVIEPSTLRMTVDGFDLPSGVVLGRVETYEINDTYPWHGAHSTAVNNCRGARIALNHDLSDTNYTLEVRAFDDGVAYRFDVPVDKATTRVPDEYSNFVLPAGSTVWFHDLDGHYEAAYEREDIDDVKPGQWAGPPLTFELPNGAGYGSITEANLVGYAGMALEADGRRGWIVGLGHRQPLNYPFELRYGRDEGKRLAKPAAIQGTIITPWRVVLATRDLNVLVNSDILPNLCPPTEPEDFPDGMNTDWVAPGLAVWDYVDGEYAPRGDRSRLEHMKNFSRMAGEIGAKYHILEGFRLRLVG